jgi:hypothetical protein
VATILASIAFGLAAILNVVATTMLTRSNFESRFQKSAQMIFIWLVPFVGAILVIAVLSQSNARLSPFSNSDANANSIPGNRSRVEPGQRSPKSLGRQGPWWARRRWLTWGSMSHRREFRLSGGERGCERVGQQSANTRNRPCRIAFRFAVIRMKFDEPISK